MTIDVEDSENAARQDKGDIQPPAGHQGVLAGNDGAAEASMSKGKVKSLPAVSEQVSGVTLLAETSAGGFAAPHAACRLMTEKPPSGLPDGMEEITEFFKHSLEGLPPTRRAVERPRLLA
ncbi:hypothetical protein IscW_ISCW001078 [Ixodes scapularis]|uniref:Uncharacterized protein n=1 Tax=Ixodes scapularis TaxID=6945 RepID=B7P511_IXOSC|nr:hypothetical protein IscW_ISCW001078 [Ixodes scapularis]|eukprot:XP_002406789.1 hypothetical protein IscW_ISCW001078 [Ixodes scapularis]